MTRILAVLASPTDNSLTSNIFHACVDAMRAQGANVDVLNLYERADSIPFYHPPLAGQPSDSGLSSIPFYNENKERIMAADRLFIVYPVWWYSVPGIMKCWLDLITNYAWKFEGGYKPKPLHHITKAFVVNSAGMPNLIRWLFTRNSASEMIKEFLRFIGVPSFRFYEIGNTYKINPDGYQHHVNQAIKKAIWLAK
jgi:putative NADPH-quinone reductase